MSELLNDIRGEIKEALEKREGDRYREMSRTAIVNTDGVGVEISQSKFLSEEEIDQARANGPASLVSREWFNDVRWMHTLPDDDSAWDQLRLDARYPLEFFAERPTNGTFSGDGSNLKWLDQYGSISGFGNRDAISTWSLSFVDTDSHTVRNLSYPSDPTALDAYNARYKQYLEQLDSADPTVSHYRAWDHPLSRNENEERDPLTIGGLYLVGIGVNEVLHHGQPGTEDAVDSTRMLFYKEGKNKKHVGRDITIIGDEAITEKFSISDKRIRKPASEKLLITALKLIKDANKF